MSSAIPTFFDFHELFQDDGTVNCVPNYNCKIGVMPWKSIYWSISLGYLMSQRLEDESFNYLFRFINLDNKDQGHIQYLLQRYNPFRNRNFIFYDEIMRNMIERFSSEIDVHLPLCSNDTKYKEILEISAKFLEYPIAVIFYQERKVKFFPEDTKCNSVNDVIVLYIENENEIKNKGAFAFGLRREQALNFKFRALKSILTQAKVSDEYINKIKTLKSINTNFIISILKNGCECVIPYLYKSRYFIGKLTEAGYQLDPKVTENGLSAFYYALLTGKIELLYMLYDSEININSKKGYDVRNPDSTVVADLYTIGSTLQRDMKESNEFEDFCKKGLKENIKITFHELYRLNKFQSKITACLHKIHQRINYRDDVSNKQFEIEKIKESIKTTLTACKEFYLVDDTMNSDNVAQQYENFVRYRNYYENFHFYATLLIFDNLHSLEKKVKFSNELIHKLKSSFFMSVYSLNFFSKHHDDCMSFSAEPCKTDEKRLLIVPFLERLLLQKQMQHFEKLFDSEKMELRSSIPSTEILLDLADFPPIKNEPLISRLEHYIDVALKGTSSLISMLAIERALQVLGESLTYKEHSHRSFNRLLRACLSQDLVKNCIKIRNLLSHMKDHEVIARVTAEENLEMFVKIQNDLKCIKEMFAPVFDLQHFEIYECMMSRAKQFVDENIEYSSLSGDIFDAFLSVYIAYAQSGKIKNNNSASTSYVKYRTILKNLFHEVECNLGDTTLLEMEPENLHGVLEDAFWPLECILKFINKYYSGNSSETLLKVIEMRQNLCKTESLVVTEQFICNLKKLLSKFKEVIITAFPDLKTFDEEESIIYQSIEELKNILQGILPISTIFKGEEKEKILNCIQQNNMHAHIASEATTTKETEKPQTIPSEASERKPQNVWQIQLSGNDCYIILKDAIKKEDASVHPLNFISQNAELYPAFEKKMKILKSRGSRLSFLRRRIKQLKLMLIENDANVKGIYENAHNEKTKSHMIDQIVEHCLMDSQLQAVMEMLLFDCMTVLNVKKDFHHLWTKKSHLFTTINMRNVLAHGNVLLESIAGLLDPEDLPTEIINMALLLIKDGEAIDAIDEWAISNDNDKDKLKIFMANDDDKMDVSIRKKIRYCPRWESYADLISKVET